jgi:thioesterase domain-containing protein
VAFEIARQLEALGEEVPLVALMDTYAPVEDYELDDLKLLMWQVWRFHLPLAVEELERLETFDQRLDFLVERTREAGIIPDHISAKEVRRGLLVEIANLRAMLAYRPGPFGGELSFFRSSEGTRFGESDGLFPWINQLDHATAWMDVTGVPVTVYEVPGDHSSLMDEPNVCVLADHLRACIANIENDRDTKEASEKVTVDSQGWMR